MAIPLQQAQSAFQDTFGAPPTLGVHAPGRVNIIGEHTDYNHGYVLPMAIDLGVTILARPHADRRLRCHSARFGATVDLPLHALQRNPEHPWIDYIAGVALKLEEAGYPLASGAEVYVDGDVPLGSGLSSSAALEMAALSLFEALGAFELDDRRAARLGQLVENEFLGVKSGIMDQFASRCGREDHAIFLDCRSLESTLIDAALPDHIFVIADTTCARRLSSSLYNTRVEECQTATETLRTSTGETGTHLRDFSLEQLFALQDLMPPVAFRRARHVMTENLRVLEAVEALQAGDALRLGALLDASHASLRDDYEVTSPELDTMTSLARTLPGCLGARMTGAGFGGCTLQLVERGAEAEFCASLLPAYREATRLGGAIYASTPAAGARRLF